MENIPCQAAASRYEIGRAYNIDAQSITGDFVKGYGDTAPVYFTPYNNIAHDAPPAPVDAQPAPPVSPTPARRSHKCKGVKAAQERAKAARKVYLRGVAASLVDTRLEFVLHLFGVFHAGMVEAAKTGKRGRVAGSKRQANIVAKLAALHGVTEYPVKDILDAFTAHLYPDGVQALTRALKRRRQEYRGGVVDPVEAVEAVEAVDPAPVSRWARWRV